MKRRRRIVISVTLLVSAALIVFAFRGSLEVENSSGKTINRIEISVDGQVVFAEDSFHDGESITHVYNAGSVKQIEMELTLGESCVSRGTIEPGMFAKVQATIDSEGAVNFGESRFQNSQVIIGSW